MKKVFCLFLSLVLLLGITGCEEKNNKSENSENKGELSSVLENDSIKIDGIYVDESYDNESLSLVYLFYTIKNVEKNNDISSNSDFKISINNVNEYSAKYNDDFKPLYSDYYYDDVIKKLYVGDSLKLCMTFEVARKDLEDNRDITFKSFKLGVTGLKVKTNYIKKAKSIEEICELLDKNIFDEKYNERQSALAEVDSATAKKVNNDIVGGVLDFDYYIGTNRCSQEFEFSKNNRVTMTATLSGRKLLTRSGKYSIRKKYIVITYDKIEDNSYLKDKGTPLEIEYFYENGEIKFVNPF